MALISGLHVLIDPGRVPEARCPAFLMAIRDGGATVVQIRIKHPVDVRTALTYGDHVTRLAKTAGLTVIMNDRVDWALAVGADGVHLGPDDLPIDRARAIAPHLLIGASAGTAEELERVLEDGRPDYLGAGPVFDTASKPDAGPALGVEGLTRFLSRVPKDIPVVAVGGIGPANVRPLWTLGVAGIAVIAAVSEARDPKAAVHQLVSGWTPPGQKKA